MLQDVVATQAHSKVVIFIKDMSGLAKLQSYLRVACIGAITLTGVMSLAKRAVVRS